ncbi:MAG: gliding motility-associated C-terminal domain-containing protein, partial [Saprospiraceae bacterium]
GNPPYTIKLKENGIVTKEVLFPNDDSILSFKYFNDPLVPKEFFIYDACGDSASQKFLGSQGKVQLLVEKACDQTYSVRSTLNNSNFDQPIKGFNYTWYQNDKIVSDSFNVKLSQFDPSDRLRMVMQSGDCIVEADEVISIDTTVTTLNIELRSVKQVFCGAVSVVLNTVINSSGPFVLDWNTGATTDSILVKDSGVYTVIIQNYQGCADTASIQILQSNPVFTNTLVTQNLCFAEANGKLDLSVSGGLSPYTFIWNDRSGDEDRTGLPNGNYSVRVVDSVGCEISAVFNINSPPPLLLTLSAHAADCIPAHNGKVIASASGGIPPYRYEWNNGLMVAEVDTLSPGFYTVKLLDINQCSSMFSFRIDDLNPLRRSHQDTICDQAFLKVGNSTYTVSGRYTDSLKTSKGCDSIITTFLTVNLPVDFILKTKDPTCTDFTDGNLQINDIKGSAPFLITLNDKVISGTQVSPIAPGNYVVKIKDRFNCVLEKGLAISNPPAIHLNLGRDTIIPFGDTLTILPVSNLLAKDIKQITWQTSPMQNNCVDCNAVYIYKPTDDHTLKATIESITGCKVSDEILVQVNHEFKVFVPNIFMPGNATNPQNQFLTVHGGRLVEKINFFRIFNRYGDLVFEGRDFLPNDTSIAWDGRFKGQDAAQGVYVYAAEVVFADGRAKILKGDVTLMR